MKKIINTPSSLVYEMGAGIALAGSGIEFLDKYKIIKKKALDPDKVTLISGGGSGHEPAHAGYVGDGMLDAAVLGDVFASPSQVQVYQALKTVSGRRGTLVIIKNYSGDLMNFSNGMHMAREEGVTVDYVKVEDDIAVNDSTYTVGRRGVAGTVLVHKIAGAAAFEGKDLQEVKAIAQHAADSVRTIGFALSSCTVPAAGRPTFAIGNDEMEYGVGIHGEPGRAREQQLTARELAGRMCEQLLADLKPEAGQAVTALINGFGGTPLQELYARNYNVQAELHARGIRVQRSFAGNFMTSIDMQGASISLMKMDETLEHYLNVPSRAPAFRVEAGFQPPVFQVPSAAAQRPMPQEIAIEDEWRTIDSRGVTVFNLAAMVKKMADTIIEKEQEFCKLDSYAGDGDFGMSVAKGFLQVKREWNDIIASRMGSPREFLLACAMIIMEHCGGASGPVWGSAFRAAAFAVGDRACLNQSEFAAMMAAAARGVQEVGARSFGRGAEVGDKTLIDALIPCAEALSDGAKAGLGFKDLLLSGAAAAVQGADNTKLIVARMGRAGTVGERSLGYPDAGAFALGVIFTAVASFMRCE